MRYEPHYIRKADGGYELINEAIPVKLIDGVELFLVQHKKPTALWVMSEGRTGTSVAFATAKKDCIERFMTRVADMGVEKFKALVERVAGQLGEAPRYQV